MKAKAGVDVGADGKLRETEAARDAKAEAKRLREEAKAAEREAVGCGEGLQGAADQHRTLMVSPPEPHHHLTCHPQAPLTPHPPGNFLEPSPPPPSHAHTHTTQKLAEKEAKRREKEQRESERKAELDARAEAKRLAKQKEREEREERARERGTHRETGVMAREKGSVANQPRDRQGAGAWEEEVVVRTRRWGLLGGGDGADPLVDEVEALKGEVGSLRTALEEQQSMSQEILELAKAMGSVVLPAAPGRGT